MKNRASGFGNVGRRQVLKAAAGGLTIPVLAGATSAAVHVTWWDFLSGGDGIVMKAMLQKFNAENPDIQIDATTLAWGTPYYTKVQTSAAVGQGPDIMTYHTSRIPLGVSTGVLRPYTDKALASVGLSANDYFKNDWDAAHVNGKLYGVPLDIHSIILYYNKDVLGKAGLLDTNGRPKSLDGSDNFNAALKKLSGGTTQYGASFASADITGATNWRIFYTMLNQMNGTFMTSDQVLPGDNEGKAVKATDTVANWVKQGWAPRNTDYPGSIALFTTGKAAMHINGDWEVPTMVNLAKANKLGFNWGVVPVPQWFDRMATWADSHTFAIPNRRGNPVPPEKVAAVLKVIAWMDRHGLMWAHGGHIPAYKPVTDSEAFKNMQPNASYASLAATAVFDPRSKIAGVASPVYDACLNFIQPAINGQMSAQSAIRQVKAELESDLE